MREQIIKLIEKEKIVIIVRGVKKKQLIPMAEAMYDGGIRLIEITYSVDGSVPDEVTAENIEMLAKHFEGRMAIGAGTVTKTTQVELTKKAGGKLIISPDTFPDIIRKTRQLDMVSIPGALTPSEVQIAHRAGADFVKLFPISSLGVGYVKAIKAPLSNIKILAVGGINNDNMSEYLAAGVCGFGIGSNIVNKAMLEKESYLKITQLAKKYVSNIKG